MPHSRNASFWWAIASVLVAMVVIQSGASLAKTLFPVIGPEGTTALRVGFAALILSLVFQPWKKVARQTGSKSSVVLRHKLRGDEPDVLSGD